MSGRTPTPSQLPPVTELTERATGIPYQVLKHRLGGILEIYEKFVGVDPHHEIPYVIVDVGKPVPDSGGNDDDVARLQVVGHSVSNGDAVAARAV